MKQATVLDKTALRKKIKILKSSFSEENLKVKSQRIIANLEVLPVFKNANFVMVYWSMKDEVFTHDLILKYYESKNIYLPAIRGNLIEIKRFTGIESMKIHDKFNILEPIGKSINLDKIDLIIVPGVAFDKECNRLGRGKAFYDKLLANFNKTKIALSFDFQLVEKIPTEDTDIKMNKIISESSIIE